MAGIKKFETHRIQFWESYKKKKTSLGFFCEGHIFGKELVKGIFYSSWKTIRKDFLVSLLQKSAKEMQAVHCVLCRPGGQRRRSIVLCVAYRPEYCPVSCFVDDFMDKYSQALTFGKNIIVAADLNCDMLKPRSLEVVALQDLCDSVNLTQLIKESTRVTETSSTLIDVIMTSSIDLVERSGVLKSHISDHYLVYALLRLKISKPPPSYVKVRSYKNYDSQCFVSDLERVPWNEVVLVDDASDMVDRFNKRFLEVLDGHAPVKSVKVKHRHCPFVNEEIKVLMRDRDRLLKRARCTGLHVDWELYRDSRRVVKIRLRKAEHEYINKEMEGCQNTSSQWKLIRNCLPRKETTQ